MNKLTPILYVDAIEPCVSFWTDRLGFAKTAEVPEGDRLGFVILAKGDMEIMYQTWASAEKDIPGLLPRTESHAAALYITVDDIDAIERAMTGADIAHPRRQTFYGATEIFVREPGGHIVGFAQPG